MARAKPDPNDPTGTPLDPAIATAAPAPAESAVPADPIVTAAPRIVSVLRVTAAVDGRWRGGLRFGRAARELDEAEVRAAAAAKSMGIEDWVALLTADPVLSVMGGSQVIA